MEDLSAGGKLKNFFSSWLSLLLQVISKAQIKIPGRSIRFSYKFGPPGINKLVVEPIGRIWMP